MLSSIFLKINSLMGNKPMSSYLMVRLRLNCFPFLNYLHLKLVSVMLFNLLWNFKPYSRRPIVFQLIKKKRFGLKNTEKHRKLGGEIFKWGIILIIGMSTFWNDKSNMFRTGTFDWQIRICTKALRVWSWCLLWSVWIIKTMNKPCCSEVFCNWSAIWFKISFCFCFFTF